MAKHGSKRACPWCMCFSERTSWFTLAIGTAANAVAVYALASCLRPDAAVVPICLVLAWQYALLMQIPDALAWRSPSATYPGKLACALNVTQPLVTLALVYTMLRRLGLPATRLAPAAIVGAAYVGHIACAVLRTSFDLRPLAGCTNLTYPWWDRAPADFYLYALCILLAIAAVPSPPLACLSVAVFVGSLAVVRAKVGTGCSPSSLWCWSVAPAGAVTAVAAFLLRPPAGALAIPS